MNGEPHPIDILRLGDIQGWMDIDELHWLYEQGTRAKHALEIGCFMGRSSCAIMHGQQKCGGRLTVVDTFDARGTVRHEDVMAAGEGWLQERFVEEVVRRGFMASIDYQILVGESHDPKVLRRVPNLSLDFLFIDGSHDYDSVFRDIELWRPKVRAGGIISGHDYHESWPQVMEAVNDSFGAEHITNPCGGIWWVRRIHAGSAG